MTPCKIEIPKTFKLGPHTYRVLQEEALQAKEGLLGRYIEVERLIKLQSKIDSLNRPDSDYQLTFNHELVHGILDIMGEKELCGNEKFVDLFANFLTQAQETAEY